MMTFQTDIVFRVPCEILEFEIEVIADGTHPEMEAFGVKIGNLNQLSLNETSLPLAMISRAIRKGMVEDHLFDTPKSENAPPSNLSTNELVSHIRAHRHVDTTTIQVIRDLTYGTFSQPWILEKQYPVKEGRVFVDCQPGKPPFNSSKTTNQDFLSLIEPHRRSLARMLDIDYHDVPKQINMVGEIHILEGEIQRQFFMRENKEQRRHWIPSGRGFNELSAKLKSNRSELQIEKEEKNLTIEWKRPIELELLDEVSMDWAHANNPKNRLNLKRRSIHIANLLKELRESLEGPEARRLRNVVPVVGTEEQQWEAAVEVLKSSNKSALLLSAFTNQAFVESTNTSLDNALQDKTKNFELHLVSGEPDRVNEHNYQQRTTTYAMQLGRHVSTTFLPSHAKFVISDTGLFWLGSCNLLSAAPNSQNSETGVLVNDVKATIDMLEHVMPWFREKEQEVIQSMLEQLKRKKKMTIEGTDHLARLEKELRTIQWDGDTKKEMKKINTRFRKITKSIKSSLVVLARTPRYSFLSTEEHRTFVIDSIAGSQKTISLASDQLRTSGFDLTVRNLILEKYSPPHTHHSTFETRIYWGRQGITSNHHDEEVKQGQKLLDALRKRCKFEIKKNSTSKSKSRQVRFLPHKESGPMSNHAKFLVQDGFRCLITSLNLFGGKSEEFDIMDATELGIVIDCDRLSQVVEGEMDLMMGAGYVDPNPLKFDPIIRLFQSVFHTALLDHEGECSLDELMDEFFRRVLDVSHNATLWHRYMNRTGVQDSLQQALKILKDMEPTIISMNQLTQIPLELKELHKAYKNGVDVPDFKSLVIKYNKDTLDDVREQFENFW